MTQRQYNGSFRGVDFKVSGDYTDEHDKQFAEHNYPFQSKGKFQSLGKKSPVYAIDFFVAGETVDQQAESIERALDDDSIGQLSHPFIGLKNVVCLRWSRTSSTRFKGRINYSATFAESEQIFYPSSSELTNLSTISSIESFTDAVQEDIADNFGVSTADSFSEAQELLERVGVSFQDITSVVSTDEDALNDIQYQVEVWSRDITTNIRDPESLSTAFTSLFNSSRGVGTTLQEKTDKWSSFFDFDDDREIKEEITISRVERANNERLIRSSVQSSALVAYYNDLVNETFTNQDDLDEVKSIAEAQYQKIVDDLEISDNVREILEEVRAAFRRYIDDQELSIANVVDITTRSTPLLKFVYQFYGDEDNYDVINSLNSIQNPAFISGTVKVVTDVSG